MTLTNLSPHQNKTRKERTIFKCSNRCRNKKEYRVAELNQHLKNIVTTTTTKDQVKFRDLEIKDRRGSSLEDDDIYLTIIKNSLKFSKPVYLHQF